MIDLHGAWGWVVGTGLGLGCWGVGFLFAVRTWRPKVEAVTCATCMGTYRLARGVHQLYVEVWDVNGVCRAKWPVGIQGGVQGDVDSVLVDTLPGRRHLADVVAARVTDIYRRGWV